MAQQFIVEGKDGFVLSALCKKQGLSMPTGYDARTYSDFVIDAGGVDQVSVALEAALEDEDNTNIGVVVDANSVGITRRITGLERVIKKIFPVFQEPITLTPKGWSAKVSGSLRVGIWVMPDNTNPGYLEHFLAEIIPPNDRNFILAQRFLEETKAAGQPSFPALREQKALLALFLSLQEEPGMNAQTAMAKGIFNHQHPLAQNFVAWFENTFELGQYAKS